MHAWQRCKRAFYELPRGLFAAFLLAWALLLGGCETATDAVDNGELVIGVTDAEGDFLNYTVAISALTLTKANGAVVEVLPLSTALDFSQYTEMTEILTAATVPSGVYVKGTMTLDYTGAEIVVEDADGEPANVPTNNIVDSAGDPIGQVEVTVHLEGRDSLVIRPGVPAHMTLDFDLKASNTVTFDNGTPTVTVEPFLLADVELERPKFQRVRGPLASVDLDRSTYQVIIRPFRHRVRGSDRSRRFGTLTVVTTDATLFDINHQSFSGEAGLQALDAQPAFTATVAVGELKFNPRRFEAREVYAGSSVPGGDMDVVRGTVLARTGDVLTVRGATLIRAGGSIAFNDNVSVILADSTVVKKQFSAEAQDIDDISIGQRVRIFGTLTNDVDLELDASNGYARMLLSVLTGTRTDDPADADQELVVDLQSMNRRRVDLYVFDGTGSDFNGGDDAAPDSYQIDTATLDLSDIETGSPLQVRGFANRFGAAPADYLAQTVIDLGALRAIMSVNWDPASATAFSSIADTGLTLDLTGTGERHHLYRGGVGVDLTGFADPAMIVPGDSGEGAFLIEQDRAVRLHTQFSTFADDLQARIDAGGVVHGVHASGAFNDADVTLGARTVWVHLR